LGAEASRGERLRDELLAGRAQVGVEALAIEAGRLADRLDHLDGLLSGGEWLHLRIRAITKNDDDTQLIVVRVTVDRALAEARQQAMTLKSILAELRLAAAGETGRPPEGNPLVKLADEIAKRRNTSAG
jgi:hypothetical protein